MWDDIYDDDLNDIDSPDQDDIRDIPRRWKLVLIVAAIVIAAAIVLWRLTG